MFYTIDYALFLPLVDPALLLVILTGNEKASISQLEFFWSYYYYYYYYYYYHYYYFYYNFIIGQWKASR